MLAISDDGIPLVLAARPATIERRRSALYFGAFDYFELPRELELLVERTDQLVTLRLRIDRLRADADLDHLLVWQTVRRFRVALEERGLRGGDVTV